MYQEKRVPLQFQSCLPFLKHSMPNAKPGRKFLSMYETSSRLHVQNSAQHPWPPPYHVFLLQNGSCKNGMERYVCWHTISAQALTLLFTHAAVQLSDDHKPNRTDERSRIEAAGGVVVWAGTWRVGGVLAVSRAFGDRLLKRYVVSA